MDSLRRRSKSIKHSVSLYECERVREKMDDCVYEKAELYFEFLGGRPFRISFNIWDDRWIWIDVRRSAKRGWAFEWQHQGRVGSVPPRELAASIVDTLMKPSYYEEPADLAADLDELWGTVAVNGPTGTV